MSNAKRSYFLFFFLFPLFMFGQKPRKNVEPGSLTDQLISELKNEFGKKKKYPPQYEKQILAALSYYPELKSTAILFRIKKRHTPLITRSTWMGLLQSKSKRHFVITISKKTESILQPILFSNLPFNAQIGVIGHELGHVTDFSAMNTFRIIRHAARNISSKYIDRFEFRTDSICIAHGLGYQLLDWSRYIRKTMHSENWDGPDYAHKQMSRERYMNPATIRKRISQSALYQQPAD